MNTKKWTMRDGNKIRIKDMTDSHLLNTVKMCIRGSVREHRIASGQLAVASAFFGGSDTQAEIDIDNAFVAHMEKSWVDFAPDIYSDLMGEVLRRGLVLNEEEYAQVLDALDYSAGSIASRCRGGCVGSTWGISTKGDYI